MKKFAFVGGVVTGLVIGVPVGVALIPAIGIVALNDHAKKNPDDDSSKEWIEMKTNLKKAWSESKENARAKRKGEKPQHEVDEEFARMTWGL